jgi:hypothetical protein
MVDMSEASANREPTMACKAQDASHNGKELLAKALLILNTVQCESQCLLDSIEYIFNRAIDGIVGCPKTMACAVNELGDQ